MPKPRERLATRLLCDINLYASGKRTTGVTFVDANGEEWEQAAELVILAAYSMFNVQLLLLSKIGQLTTLGAIGICIDEFNGDNFDHGPLGFVGGGYISRCRPAAAQSKRPKFRQERRDGVPNGKRRFATIT
jgi:hypothetical protein